MARPKSISIDRRNMLKSGMMFAFGSAWMARPQAAMRAMAQTPVATPGTPPVAPTGDGGWGEFIEGTTPGSPEHPNGFVTQMPTLPENAPFDPPVAITASRVVGATVEFTGGDDINDNPFTRMMSRYVGVDFSAKWQAANVDDYKTKLNTSIASGDLPDYMERVDLFDFQMLLEADLVEDITDAWDANASETVVLEPMRYGGDPTRAWAYAEVDGRKMGIPSVITAMQDEKVMWIRQDWLDKVGMDIPTTLEELEAVAGAFVEAGLGENGNTVGLGICGQLNTWYGSADPIFGAFGAVPQGSGAWWTVEGDGLICDAIREEQKPALEMLQRMYANGLIAPDFFTLDAAGVQEQVAGNNCGLHFSPSFATGYGINSSVENDPSAVWACADIPAGPDGRRGKAWSNPYAAAINVMRKGFPHAAEMVQVLNFTAELRQPELQFIGWEGSNYILAEDGTLTQTYNSPTKWFYGPVGGDSGAGVDPLNDAKRLLYNQAAAEIPFEERNAYQKFWTEENNELGKLNNQAAQLLLETSEEYGIVNEFMALPTETMNLVGSQLIDLEAQTSLGIIKGDLPLEAFDSYVEQWKGLGGDQVTAEVNEWWANR